jgi:thymidylate kinase
MLLIIEGMDRCGKSTLVESLRKNYFVSPNTFVHHSSSPPKVENPNSWELNHYDSMFHMSKFMVNNSNFDVIFDRFHLGSAVYGKKYRNMDPMSVYALDKMHLKDYTDAALILLTDDPEAIASRDDGESLEKSIHEYNETLSAFIEAYNMSSCLNKRHINISGNGGFHNTYPTVTKFLDEVRGNHANS